MLEYRIQGSTVPSTSKDRAIKMFRQTGGPEGGRTTKYTIAPGNIHLFADAVRHLVLEEGVETLNCNCVYEEGWTIWGHLPGSRWWKCLSCTGSASGDPAQWRGPGNTPWNCNCVYEEGWTIDHARELYRQLKETSDMLRESGTNTYVSILDWEAGQTLLFGLGLPGDAAQVRQTPGIVFPDGDPAVHIPDTVDGLSGRCWRRAWRR